MSTGVGGWHTSYLLAGTASASLLGLLFLTVSIQVNRISQQRFVHVRSLAIEVLADFGYALLVALATVVPGQTAVGIGVPVIVVGTAGLVGLATWWRRFRNEPPSVSAFARASPRRWRTHFTVKLVCYLAMVVTGVGLLTNRGQFLYALGGVEAILPASGAVTAWDLLIRTGPLPDGPR